MVGFQKLFTLIALGEQWNAGEDALGLCLNELCSKFGLRESWVLVDRFVMSSAKTDRAVTVKFWTRQDEVRSLSFTSTVVVGAFKLVRCGLVTISRVVFFASAIGAESLKCGFQFSGSANVIFRKSQSSPEISFFGFQFHLVRHPLGLVDLQMVGTGSTNIRQLLCIVQRLVSLAFVDWWQDRQPVHVCVGVNLGQFFGHL